MIQPPETARATGRRTAALVALAACAALMVPGAADARWLPGTKLRDYIQGTAKTDRMPLRAGADRGFGRRGADRIGGGAGPDRLFGGPGRDLVAGGRGADAVWGGRGPDRIFGGPGPDLLSARDGRVDRAIAGGPGRDVCVLDPAEVPRARGCELISVPGDPRGAVAYGIWQPGRGDTCPAWLHDANSVVGPDGLRYPAWHPPAVRNPATGRRCRFGHEHGRDPGGSHLIGWIARAMRAPGGRGASGVPFGVANQALDRFAAASGDAARHEDHVGHKIEWVNDLELRRPAPGGSEPAGVTCDVLTKVHQGSHSHDALGNNVHELIYAARCSDGAELLVTKLAAFGEANSFTRSCEPDAPVGAGTSHSYPPGEGARLIPDRECVERHLLVGEGSLSDYRLGLYEEWRSVNELRADDGRRLAFFDPSFSVLNPSRYAGAAGAIARTIGACFETEPGTGDRARGGYCEAARAYGGPLSFDDPRSGFDGGLREVGLGETEVTNGGGPGVWFTDPYGGSGATEPFAGSIRQLISPVDNRRAHPLAPVTIGSGRHYGRDGVHAPN